MTTAPAPTLRRHSYTSLLPGRAWSFGALAFAWYALSTFVLPLPGFVSVFVLGLFVMLTLAPDSRTPTRGIASTRRNLVLTLLALAAFVPVALGMDLLLGRIPIESGSSGGRHLRRALRADSPIRGDARVLAPRAARAPRADRRRHRGRRLRAHAIRRATSSSRSSRSRSSLPLVMAVRRLRLGANSPRQLRQRNWALQAANFWLFLALVAAAGFAGTLAVWQVFVPDAEALIAGAFWIGLVATALLVAFPRRRISVATNVLVALGSIFLAVQLVRIYSGPTDAVTIGVPFTEEWYVASGGRSTLVNSHWSLNVQRDAIDFVQLVDGKTLPRRQEPSRELLHLTAIRCSRSRTAGSPRPSTPIPTRPSVAAPGTTWPETTSSSTSATATTCSTAT